MTNLLYAFALIDVHALGQQAPPTVDGVSERVFSAPNEDLALQLRI
jgi:hypothetical protein